MLKGQIHPFITQILNLSCGLITHKWQGDPVLSRQASRHLEALFWANTYVPSLVIAPAITNVVNQITETAMGNVVGRYGKREGGG